MCGQPFDGDFEEDFYLVAYPDVAAAVREGSVESGARHFLDHGRREGRVGSRLQMFARLADYDASGRRFARQARWPGAGDRGEEPASVSPLRQFFENRRTGRGIWKWRHYFDVYDRHFARFRDREAHVLEVGVYSGGSLEMWCSYFGPGARIYGVDVDPRCEAYRGGQVRIFTGDQGDRDFWRHFRREVPVLDVVIDDGGHLPLQQIATLEELLPHLRPGGVYLCEDVHGEFNPFAAYCHGVADVLNAYENMTEDQVDAERRVASVPIPFQACVASVSFYPFTVVIERNEVPLKDLVAPKHGTEWLPSLR